MEGFLAEGDRKGALTAYLQVVEEPGRQNDCTTVSG